MKTNIHTKINKIFYTLHHQYLTFNNLVILVAFLIAAGWAWGSLQVMQRNYALQREVDYKRKQLTLAELQKDNLRLQNQYYQTDEYKELALRESLGLVMPGEKLLILPDNSDEAKAADEDSSTETTVTVQQSTNLEQWLNFLFGGYSKIMQSSDSDDDDS